MATVKIANAEYEDVTQVELETPDGETVTFTEGGTVPSIQAQKTITENGTYTADSGYDYINKVIVNVAGGLAYATELYYSDSTSITYTSTTAGTALTVSGLTGTYNYPFVVVIIENTNTASTGTAKFIRSCVTIGNTKFGQSSASVTRYGVMHYYTTGNVLTNYSGSSYGLFGYTLGSSSVTIRGRCNSTYCSTLTGTYKIRILGIKF